MTISKRTLIKWRKESLKLLNTMPETIPTGVFGGVSDKNHEIVYHERILHLTQELIDQELLKESKNA